MMINYKEEETFSEDRLRFVLHLPLFGTGQKSSGSKYRRGNPSEGSGRERGEVRHPHETVTTGSDEWGVHRFPTRTLVPVRVSTISREE